MRKMLPTKIVLFLTKLKCLTNLKKKSASLGITLTFVRAPFLLVYDRRPAVNRDRPAAEIETAPSVNRDRPATEIETPLL